MRPGVRLCSFAAAAAISAPGWAAAFTCTPVTDRAGQPVVPAVSQVWVNRCIPYVIDEGSALFASEARRQLVNQSFAVWDNHPCTDLELTGFGYADAKVGFDPRNADDNENLVTSIDDASNVSSFFPQPNMVAITITAFSTVSGEIFDADIIVNNAAFTFEDVGDEAACMVQADPPFDLRAILIHEVGHFIGFDHANATDSTMYFSAPVCETQKRSLTADDIAGLCAVYPRGRGPETCAPPSGDYDDVEGADGFRDQCERALEGGGGCRCGGAAPEGLPGLGALLLVGALLGRRRRG